MDVHAAATETLAAFVLDACDADEAETVEAHLATCAACLAEADRLRSAAAWIGVDQAVPPPARLRGTVLARAREARPASPFRTLIEAYAIQVTRLDGLLTALDRSDWQRPDPRHGNLAGVVAHLSGNDALLAADLGLPVIPERPPAAINRAWRDQAEGLLALDGADLERPVRLAGHDGPRRGVLRDALVQRAFETWTHLEDVGRIVGRATAAPPPEQVRRIVRLATGLLPAVLGQHGLSRSGAAVRLVLTGTAGGEWTVPLGAPPHEVVAMITTEAVEFARLAANRRAADTLPHTVTGDATVADQLLRIAATLGCD